MNLYTDQELKNPAIDRMVYEEHKRQIAKWGVQSRTAFEWITYLTEEVGELAEAVSEQEYRGGASAAVTKEAIQVATLALKIAEMFHDCKGQTGKVTP
jgi:NTP pyrophosphatase (non-canonical NTP hydrolase)